jgi:hypothetical protein
MRTNCDFLSIHDHQLLVDWIKGGVVWKTFQAIDGKKIIHACFAQFSGQTSGGEPTVCLLTTETLVVYPWQGPEMVIRLPDRPEKVNSLATGGLLLQLGDKSLYSLLNPFGHLQPIGFSRSVPPAKPIENLPIQPGSINDDATATSTVDSRWQIIHFDPASSLLIFIDPVEMTHYAWNIHADTSTSCVWKESCTNNV